jgi:hypothetical protein
MNYGDLFIAVITFAVATRVNVGYALAALVTNAIFIFIRVSYLDVSLTGVTLIIAVAIRMLGAAGIGRLTACRYDKYGECKECKHQNRCEYLSVSF